MVFNVVERIVAIGRAENRAALREDAGHVVPTKPFAMTGDEAAKRVEVTEHLPAVRVDRGLHDAANNGVEARRVAAAGKNADALDLFYGDSFDCL
jgi:hypothetical protein